MSATLPARYTIGQFSLVFLKQYKYMGIYDTSTGTIIATHSLVNGRKLWVDTSTGELVVDAAPSTSLFKTAYSLDTNGYVFFDNNSIIIGTGDPSNGVQLTVYPLDNLTDCPNVVIVWDSANHICVKTACGDGGCTIVNSACKVVTDQDNMTCYS